ncbi:hypothetical protein GQ44DRAFT_762019 [Phaeosphaeriaceae sp. PMI808]|nr:hypothetical protein GQ44DRAFT_762019 [Phaeosphaeriaceae sp. PMI808]
MVAENAFEAYGSVHRFSIWYICHYGLILLAQEKWIEAEELFTDLSALIDGGDDCNNALLDVMARGFGATRVHPADLTTITSVVLLFHFTGQQRFKYLLVAISTELGMGLAEGRTNIKLTEWELAKLGDLVVSLDEGLKGDERFAHCEMVDRPVVRFAHLTFKREFDGSEDPGLIKRILGPLKDKKKKPSTAISTNLKANRYRAIFYVLTVPRSLRRSYGSLMDQRCNETGSHIRLFSWMIDLRKACSGARMTKEAQKRRRVKETEDGTKQVIRSVPEIARVLDARDSCCNCSSASPLGLIKTNKDIFIVFDYNNLEHSSNCAVLGFRVKKKKTLLLKPISIPKAYVHETISKWLDQNKRFGLSFPREEEPRQPMKKTEIKSYTPLSSNLTMFE